MPLPAGGGDTSADLVACCTLRPESVRNREKSAGWRPANLTAADATDASLADCEMHSVGATKSTKTHATDAASVVRVTALSWEVRRFSDLANQNDSSSRCVGPKHFLHSQELQR